jgi:hypothetical protein
MNTKILSSIMVIGIALMMGMTGGIAWFSDYEASNNNFATAGSLDLKVDFKQWYNGDPVRPWIGVPFPGDETGDQMEPQPQDLDGSPLVTLGDVKPGDYGKLKFSLHVDDNPAYLCLHMQATRNDEVNMTEPERNESSDETGNTGSRWDGELIQNIEVFIWNDTNGNCSYDDGEPSEGGWMPLSSVMDPMGDLTVTDLTCLDLHEIDPCNVYWLGIMWRIPETVGNEIQTDTMSFDIKFQAVQQRHLGCKVYGASDTSKALYGIFPEDERVELLYDLDDDMGDQYSPNGLAYDPIHDRLYFSAVGGSSHVKYYDFEDGNIHDLITVDDTVYGATCKGGDYYYVANGSDALMMIPIDPNTGAGAPEVIVDDINGGTRDYSFGDIDFTSDGKILVGSTTNGDGAAYFTYNMVTEEFKEASIVTGAEKLQIAFCHNGVLWGQTTRNPTAGEFFQISNPLDPDSASASSWAVITTPDGYGFNDLAAVHPCTNR